MAIGRQKSARQADLLVSTSDLARSPGHPFYERVNVLLSKADFNAFADADRPLRARRTLQLHVEVGRHRARRFARARLLHQVPRRGPQSKSAPTIPPLTTPGNASWCSSGVQSTTTVSPSTRLSMRSPFAFAGPQPKHLFLGA